MLICLSGRYVEQELALHYGRITPAFLPIAGERLLTVLRRRFGQGERCILTLPVDFELSDADEACIAEAGFEAHRTDPTQGLTGAILEVLAAAAPEEPVRLLFGDTLVDLGSLTDAPDDFAVVKASRIDYPWTYGDASSGTARFFAHDAQQIDEMRVVCGYFRFNDPGLMREAFAQPTLHDALNAYSEHRTLALVDADTWNDFGHLALFYRSKRDLLVARTFNSLNADELTLTKTSHQTAKMHAEAVWYETIPPRLALHTPRYIGRQHKAFKAGYQLEYLHLPTLSDMLVFGRLPQTSIALIQSRCLRLLKTFRDIQPEAEAPEASPQYAARFYDEIIERKTWTRLESFCEGFDCGLDTEFSLNGQRLPALGPLVERVLAQIPRTTPDDICFWHGDFFFGNLFFDFNTQRVIMVDPRGMLFDNVLTQFGDYRYDLGKLAHSVLGGYDHIIAHQVSVARPAQDELNLHLPAFEAGQAQKAAQQFCARVEAELGVSQEELTALAAMMFFSMLPLHHDNPKRQNALFANALRLAQSLEG